MSSKTGSDLFIVDNSDEEWKVLNGLASRGWLEREDALHAFKAWLPHKHAHHEAHSNFAYRIRPSRRPGPQSCLGRAMP